MKKVLVLMSVLLVVLLASCGYVKDALTAQQNDRYEEGYADGYAAGYQDGYDDFTTNYRPEASYEEEPVQRPVSRPASGEILCGSEYGTSEITVTASNDYDYVVMLKNWARGYATSFYVRAGDTVSVSVPAAYLNVYFASGTEWYGYGEGLMFGEETRYSKDDEMVDFESGSWEYTLYEVSDGNFSETPINEDEFF